MEQKKAGKKGRILGWIALGAVIAGLVALYFWMDARGYLAVFESTESLQEFVSSFGMWAPLVFILLQIAQVIGPYKQGKFRDYPHLFRYFRAKEVTVRCGEMRVVNLDGEARYAETAHFSVVPQGIRFFYPRGLSYHAAVPAHAE